MIFCCALICSQLASGVATPMLPADKLASADGDCLSPENATRYRSGVGALQYLSLTRPDISFSINRVCQYMSSLTTVHWVAVKRILRYLCSTIDFGLQFTKSSSMLLSAFSDANWAGNVDDRHSTGAMLYFLVVISLHGVQGNKLRFHNQVRRPNIKLWLMLLLKLYGFRFCFVNLGFLCRDLQAFGATTLVLLTLLLIRSSIGA